jgi:hypothetical protein
VNNDPVNYVDLWGLECSKASDAQSKWTNNGDGTYTAKAGATLYDLYGPNWQEQSGFTRDPTTLQIGETVGQKNPVTPTTSPTAGIGYSPPAPSGIQNTPQTGKTGQTLQGDIFVTLEIDLVAVTGIEASISLVIDLDHPLESGINVSAGPAAGVNVGYGVGFGYTRGDLDGQMPVGGDVNAGPYSGSLLTDEKGVAGFSFSTGLGGGLTASSQNSAPLSPQSGIDFIDKHFGGK